jgi:hypothetical protein
MTAQVAADGSHLQQALGDRTGSLDLAVAESTAKLKEVYERGPVVALVERHACSSTSGWGREQQAKAIRPSEEAQKQEIA